MEQSPTGTSLAVSERILSAIKTPVFFNAVGVDDAQGYTFETLSRFRKFLRRLLLSSQYMVTVRNDGAMETLRTHVPDLALDTVRTLPDGGFFAHFPEALKRPDGIRIGINLAGDMLSRRFPGGSRHTFNSFLSEMAKWIVQQVKADETISFILFPHIYKDMRVCADLLEILPDEIRRERVRVAAYDSGQHAAQLIFGEYRTCDVILGMRFHANVVAIGHEVPTVGLNCYAQIQRLFNELTLSEHCVDVTLPKYSYILSRIVQRILKFPKSARSQAQKIRKTLLAKRNIEARYILKWLARHHLNK